VDDEDEDERSRSGWVGGLVDWPGSGGWVGGVVVWCVWPRGGTLVG
jgi:hypothetical protein